MRAFLKGQLITVLKVRHPWLRFLNVCSGYMTVYVCQNALNYTTQRLDFQHVNCTSMRKKRGTSSIPKGILKKYIFILIVYWGK